jgi:two-component system nitrogen regulation response regulator GlnG
MLQQEENEKNFKCSFSKLLEVKLEEYLLAQRSNKENLGGLYNMVINEAERVICNAVLRYSNGNLAQASRILGINRNTFRKKITKPDNGENDN